MLLLLLENLSGQTSDLVAISESSGEKVSYLLFNDDGTGYRMLDAFDARRMDLARNYPQLALSADFTGDGLDELALFNDLEYTPNMNPAFTRPLVTVSRSNGEHFISSGTWYTTSSTQMDFTHVSFTVAGDYNQDGLTDIALFYNDPSLDSVTIYLLESSGSGFSEALPWYSVNRNEFNFTALKFACPGDFNGNGKPDIAVFYNYFGSTPETKQSVFLFESEGDSFSLLPAVYNATKAEYDFSYMKFALPGDYNLDGFGDIAVLYEDPADQNLVIPVFKGSMTGELTATEFISFPDGDPDPAHVVEAAGGNFAGDTAADLALFYNNPLSGSQEILVLESDLTSFKAPEIIYSTDLADLSMETISVVRSGTFVKRPMVTAATWKDDRQGAISFTFDDGYRGAFEHGGAELDAAGLKGTFYIFTDTTASYDGELATTSLVREYKERGHEIGSHTANHSNLGFLTESGNFDSLEQVLSASVELLNERFDQNTVSMSIPFGSFRYETLEYISRYFLSARSSQFGFNLSTPYDFFALKSWPVLSTTTPAYVANLLDTAETYGYYLPLMYHDMMDVAFDEESLIYTYSRELFRQTVQSAVIRDLWIDTHERIYKYIRERNALKVMVIDRDYLDAQPGHFSFIADDELADSLFNVELTLKIFLPQSWVEDSVTLGTEGGFSYAAVQQGESGNYILFNWLPVSGVTMDVHEGKLPGTGLRDRDLAGAGVGLTAAPNPFNHESMIQVTGQKGMNSYLIVRDIHGRIVREIRDDTGETFHLSRENLSPGIYIIQLIDAGRQVASLKLLAQ
jgi:peptidoglycan/xylan/chitin deacetylase (PgdA/CDA1 family)